MPTFVKFANGLMNHSNKLLDDALNTLPKIRALRLEQQDGAAWAALTQEQQEARTNELQEAESLAKNSLLLANETVDMLSYLSEHIHQPFLCPELVDRLAALLMSTIKRLSGARGVQLKVGDCAPRAPGVAPGKSCVAPPHKARGPPLTVGFLLQVDNPERYGFKPKQMLLAMCRTVVHLAPFPEFVSACAACGQIDEATLNKAVNKHVARFGECTCPTASCWQRGTGALRAREV